MRESNKRSGSHPRQDRRAGMRGAPHITALAVASYLQHRWWRRIRGLQGGVHRSERSSSDTRTRALVWRLARHRWRGVESGGHHQSSQASDRPQPRGSLGVKMRERSCLHAAGSFRPRRRGQGCAQRSIRARYTHSPPRGCMLGQTRIVRRSRFQISTRLARHPHDPPWTFRPAPALQHRDAQS